MATAHDTAVFCISDDRAKTISILNSLRDIGVRESEISLIMPHEDGGGDIAIQGNTKAPEGAATGAGSGMVLGGVLGWMAGIGALAIPGLGPFIAAGPIMAALSGAALGGAAGTLTGGLIGLGFSEYEAKQYEGYLRDGNALISVSVADSDEASRVKEIFKDADAKHISSQGVQDAD